MDSKKGTSCCSNEAEGSRCRLEALVPVDERGQMVLPKDLRERAGIAPGDKLAIVSWEAGGQVCCITMLKADSMAEKVREVLGPFLKDLAGMANGGGR